MDLFDTIIIDYLNQFARISWKVDAGITLISENHLAKGGVLLTVYWWGWFASKENQAYVRVHLISTIIGCFIAMILARATALLAPFRLRPLHEHDLEFVLPYGLEPTMLSGWSSFPSDHATLFYALSTGMFFISKRIGIIATAYTTLFIVLPRVYLGFHYPTDVIGGALIGVVIVLLCNRTLFTEKISRAVLDWSNSASEIFYPASFIVTYQIVDMFEASRSIVKFLI